MSLLERTISSETLDDDRPLRFRPSARRRNRLALGALLGAIAIGGNVAAYTSLSDTEGVVQAVRDIPAGEVISVDDLRIVEVSVDPSVNTVAGEDLATAVGSYAKVRIVSGSLLVPQALQATPLVEPGRAVVAVVVAPAELPSGLRERVPVRVVIPPRSADGETQVVDAVTVGIPIDVESALGERSVSLEMAVDDAPTVAAADRVRLVLLEPAATGEGG